MVSVVRHRLHKPPTTILNQLENDWGRGGNRHCGCLSVCGMRECGLSRQSEVGAGHLLLGAAGYGDEGGDLQNANSEQGAARLPTRIDDGIVSCGGLTDDTGADLMILNGGVDVDDLVLSQAGDDTLDGGVVGGQTIVLGGMGDAVAEVDEDSLASGHGEVVVGVG